MMPFKMQLNIRHRKIKAPEYNVSIDLESIGKREISQLQLHVGSCF